MAHNRSLVEWEVTEDDGRPDFEERKRCNFETDWLATCPDKLLGVCKTEEEVKRMQFWELVSDKFEYESWDTDKCPAVKYVLQKISPILYSILTGKLSPVGMILKKVLKIP